MIIKQGTVVLAAMIFVAVFLASNTFAQNPSFAGQEFRRIWTDGTVPQGASAAPTFTGSTDFYMTPAGLYIQTYVHDDAIHFVDDSGAVTVAADSLAEFSEAQGFIVVGWKPDGSLIFNPASPSTNYPCYLYNGSGSVALSSPTRQQTLTFGNYFDGRMVYMTVSGSSGTKLWYYTEGNPPELWLEDDDLPGLATMLDYDGETLAFSVYDSGTGGYELWRRAADGTLTRILENGDLMPGEEASTFVSTPAVDTVEVDQGKVYMLASGASPNSRVLFSSADGVTFDVIAKRYQEIPGLNGITINDMLLKQVNDENVWLWVKQSDGDKVLYQISNGVWTRVAGQFDTYDGRTAVGFEAFEHGMLSNSVVVAVSFFDFDTFSLTTDLYVNGDLPGFSSAPAGAVMDLVRELDGSLTVSAMGEAGATNTLLATSSLTNTVWDAVGTVVADGAGLMEWTVNPTNDARFFRLVE